MQLFASKKMGHYFDFKVPWKSPSAIILLSRLILIPGVLTITSIFFTKTNYCPLSLYTKIMVSHGVSLLKETGYKFYHLIKSAPDI